jgi:hypothetical protein
VVAGKEFGRYGQRDVSRRWTAGLTLESNANGRLATLDQVSVLQIGAEDQTAVDPDAIATGQVHDAAQRWLKGQTKMELRHTRITG